eukprot:SAG22_NODE_22_length_31438_cov_47.016529_10_plen_335_part_00
MMAAAAPAAPAQAEAAPAAPAAPAAKRRRCGEEARPTVLPANSAAALADCIARREPAVVRGMGAGYPCCSEWGQPGSAFRTAADRSFDVFVSNRDAGRFYLDGTAHPDALLTASMRMPMTLRQFFSRDGGDDHGGSGGAEAAAGPGGTAAAFSRWKQRYLVEDRFSDELPIRAAPPASMPALGESPFLRAFGADRFVTRQLFCSHGHTRTQVHRDCWDNLYLCCFGQRCWQIAHRDHDLAREAGSVSAAAKDAFPASVVFEGVQLQAGDGLFLPAGWWHEVSSSGSSCAINWYFRPPPGPAGPVDRRGPWPSSPSSALLPRPPISAAPPCHAGE